MHKRKRESKDVEEDRVTTRKDKYIKTKDEIRRKDEASGKKEINLISVERYKKGMDNGMVPEISRIAE